MTRNSMQATDRHQDDAGIAQRYLAGQLSPPEQEAYEQYFIHNPDAVRELEATARMKVGLASLRDSGQLDSLLQVAPTTSRRAALMAIAASVAVIAIVVGLWRDVRVPDGAALVALGDAPGRCVGEAARGWSDLRGDAYARDWTTMRSSRYLRSLRRSSCACCLNGRRLPTTLPCPELAPSGAVVEVATVSDLQVRQDGFVNLYVDSSKLEPGLYLLGLSASQGQTSEISTSSFRLKVVGADASPGSR